MYHQTSLIFLSLDLRMRRSKNSLVVSLKLTLQRSHKVSEYQNIIKRRLTIQAIDQDFIAV